MARKKTELHGSSYSRTYGCWRSMRERCNNPNCVYYAHYGGRGIKVCEQWESFVAFQADMGDQPKGMWLDRINNDGDYEPGNCRWATPKEQASNRRNSIHMELGGKKVTLTEAARLSGLNIDTVHYRRRRGWPQECWLEPLRYRYAASA